MNLVVLDVETGEILDTNSFNTHLSLYHDDITLWKVIGKVHDDKIILLDADNATEQFWALDKNTIDLTNKAHRKYLLKTWLQTKNWGTTAETPSEVIWYQDKPTDTVISIAFAAGTFTRKGTEALHIYINGTFADVLPLPFNSIEHIFLPEDRVNKGFNLLRFESSHPQESLLIGIREIGF
jgi:hypothetical protein